MPGILEIARNCRHIEGNDGGWLKHNAAGAAIVRPRSRSFADGVGKG
jgi:hypothetical protein